MNSKDLREAAAKLWKKARQESLSRKEKDICVEAYWAGAMPAPAGEFGQWVEDGCPSIV